tara:strand:- start:10970 stop:11182 length:213 start_codon:yes stop_codon:yes gene_type:complete
MKKKLLTDEQIRRFMEAAGWEKMNEEELMEAVANQLEAMVKLGQVEQLIGEDGEFYYRSTGTFPSGTTDD